ncbi:hypothetical protein P262_01977 [Cronobacter malonaticus]|uniref:Uncharacterized protein n=2 Tax=Cronobacter TaxID=413496 RepID=A7MHL1_CROS8|nr:hypothetical protein ESA_01112 [Cronobacter sakazakii ATCC BAA-894]AHB69765.1 hypothetical protein P262_01977 [Cronobacter malonaticus]CCJ93329.1 hypothetical protein BN131_1002 [Cronobacter malonaticus 681]CCJ96841.1 hypothetical protein BN130_1485 [Cronobacter malonaticus 507]CCK03247.1 hypothetical protein BN129_1886 [Cronobacter sakazakii 701]CCK07698.1 hypothetical protein BN128_1663 [Cronobacter sakazakii 696]CCK13020.1 hypothetical protein BN126_3211 [Cronobacter sakazakii 680]
MQDNGVAGQHNAADTADGHQDHAGDKPDSDKFHALLLMLTA